MKMKNVLLALVSVLTLSFQACPDSDHDRFCIIPGDMPGSLFDRTCRHCSPRYYVFVNPSVQAAGYHGRGRINQKNFHGFVPPAVINSILLSRTSFEPGPKYKKCESVGASKSTESCIIVCAY